MSAPDLEHSRQSQQSSHQTVKSAATMLLEQLTDKFLQLKQENYLDDIKVIVSTRNAAKELPVHILAHGSKFRHPFINYANLQSAKDLVQLFSLGLLDTEKNSFSATSMNALAISILRDAVKLTVASKDMFRPAPNSVLTMALKACGFNVHQRDTKNENTVLHVLLQMWRTSSAQKHIPLSSLVSAIIEMVVNGAYLNAVNKSQETPLDVVCLHLLKLRQLGNDDEVNLASIEALEACKGCLIQIGAVTNKYSTSEHQKPDHDVVRKETGSGKILMMEKAGGKRKYDEKGENDSSKRHRELGP
jgi:hypothetical protein